MLADSNGKHNQPLLSTICALLLLLLLFRYGTGGCITWSGIGLWPVRLCPEKGASSPPGWDADGGSQVRYCIHDSIMALSWTSGINYALDLWPTEEHSQSAETQRCLKVTNWARRLTGEEPVCYYHFSLCGYHLFPLILPSFFFSSFSSSSSSFSHSPPNLSSPPSLLYSSSRSSLSTYKELCSLASDLNQPDLVYKFMHLANHHALWNSKKVRKNLWCLYN